MSDKIWNSDKWLSDPSDSFTVDDRDGFLRNFTIHKLEDGSRVMYCNLFRPGLVKYAELTIKLGEETDKNAFAIAQGAFQHIVGFTKR